MNSGSLPDTININEDLQLIRVTEHAYAHISYDTIGSYGRIPSDGMLYIDGDKGFLFDTPYTDSTTKILVNYIQEIMRVKLVGFVPNHFHGDCVGGLATIHKAGIPSYANVLTITLAKENNMPVPQQGFIDSLHLKLNDKDIICRYLGAAHSPDNIVVYLPSEKVLFAGCMAKEMKSMSRGNLGDADVKAWPVTIQKVIDSFPDAKIVIPGHGAFGGKEILFHTLEIFSK
ncbi:MAG: subclass B1 metallo-beta-lactamase [Ignavibacteria bacterium]|nr:subclass B1 metallo-beta-lactamase [Ignavibacteria bacterium]